MTSIEGLKINNQKLKGQLQGHTTIFKGLKMTLRKKN